MVCGLQEGTPEEMAFPLDLKDEETRPRREGRMCKSPGGKSCCLLEDRRMPVWPERARQQGAWGAVEPWGTRLPSTPVRLPPVPAK